MTGYNRDRSRHTVRAIEAAQYSQVLDAARSFRHPAWFGEISAAQLVEFLYLTACHPDVLARPGRAQLRCSAQVDGMLHILWTRPKKEGLRGETDLPLAKLGGETAHWIPGFIRQVHAHPYTVRHLHRLLRAIGESAKVPLSARVLRHTRGVDVGRRTRDPAIVAWWLNCSPSTAAEYLRLAGSSDPRVLSLAVA